MFKIIENEPKIFRNKRLCLLFLIANFGCIYKKDLFYFMGKIYPDLTEYYFNNALRTLLQKKYIHSTNSSNRPRYRIYYIVGKGWQELEKVFEKESENYIRLMVHKVNITKRTISKYYEEQATITSINALLNSDMLPIETPTLPGRISLSKNPSGKFVPFSSKEDLENIRFCLPWFLLCSDNKKILKNNIINSLWSINNGVLDVILVFKLFKNKNSNKLYNTTFKELRERIYRIAQFYELEIGTIYKIVSVEAGRLDEYVPALTDLLIGEKQKNIYFKKDRYETPQEFLRDKNFRAANKNVDAVHSYPASIEKSQEGFYYIPDDKYIIYSDELKNTIDLIIGGK